MWCLGDSVWRKSPPTPCTMQDVVIPWPHVWFYTHLSPSSYSASSFSAAAGMFVFLCDSTSSLMVSATLSYCFAQPQSPPQCILVVRQGKSSNSHRHLVFFFPFCQEWFWAQTCDSLEWMGQHVARYAASFVFFHGMLLLLPFWHLQELLFFFSLECSPCGCLLGFHDVLFSSTVFL